MCPKTGEVCEYGSYCEINGTFLTEESRMIEDNLHSIENAIPQEIMGMLIRTACSIERLEIIETDIMPSPLLRFEHQVKAKDIAHHIRMRREQFR